MSSFRRYSTIAIWLGLVVCAHANPFGGAPQPDQSITHKMMMMALQVGVILFAARLSGMLAERMRLPGVLGELMGGVVIGPHALGSHPMGGMFPHGLFPLASETFPVSPELYGFCSIAAIILLFLAGAETDLKLFLRYSVAGSLVGIGGVVASFLAGDLLAMALLPRIVGGPYAGGVGFMHPACLFLGIMSTATSVGITARILSEKRKIDSPEGTTILAGAVIDDVLGIIVLAIGMGVLAAGEKGGPDGIDWGHIGVIAGKAFGIWLGATAVGVLAARRISKLLKLFRDPTAIAVMALGLALILGGVFEEMGLAMIIGAYVMGLALGRTDIRNVIHEHLHPIHTFMVPIFFTVMGMMVDLHQLASPKVLMFGGIYTLLAILAKIVGCSMAAFGCGFTPLGALRVGAGMTPRGEVALIVAGIGLSEGFLTPDIFGVGVLMTLVTTLAAPPLLVALFDHAGEGLRHPAPKDDASRPFAFTMPSANAAALMCDRLLEAFRADGFYTHTLSHEDAIFQIRRDLVVIGMRRQGAELQFECSPSEEAFISTALIEVIADMESTARELRKPIDTGTLNRRRMESPSDAGLLEGIASAIRKDTLVPHLRAKTKAEAIDELLGVLVKARALKDTDAARKAVWNREDSMSTGLEQGVAIPHGRTDAVACLVCAIGLSPEGIAFDAADGQPARIIVLTLSPASQPAPHVQFIAHISQTLNAEGRMLLLACHSPEEMAAVLAGDLTEREGGPLREIRRRLTAGAKAQASFAAQFVRPELTVPNLRARTIEDAVYELLDRAVDQDLVKDVEAARRAVLTRESQFPTGLGHGVAIPHARTDAAAHLFCVVGRSPQGIDFHAPDGQLVHIVVLTVSPLSAAEPQVRLMARLSRILDETGRARVRAAETAEGIVAAFTA